MIVLNFNTCCVGLPHNMVTYKRCNTFGVSIVIGMCPHAHMRQELGTWTCCSGVEKMVVLGMEVRALPQQEVVT